MAFKGWDKKIITNDQSEEVTAMAPVIISASRSTDIPAFHHQWFFNRLKKGHCIWKNPFSQKKHYVSFENARAFVFWTKNPELFIARLNELDDRKLNYYFQFTLNDYDNEGLEPSVPKLHERIDTFKKLSTIIGKDGIIWRFDPLILSNKLSVESLIDRISGIASELADYTSKLVISFIDIAIYKKVQRNLKIACFNCHEFNDEEVFSFAEKLKEIGDAFNLDIATCSEEYDLSEFGIFYNKCIDDEALMGFLGYEPNINSHLKEFVRKKSSRSLKDKGQRKHCGCIASKDIGQYNTCGHLCSYCYANTSERVVRKNLMQKATDNWESILVS